MRWAKIEIEHYRFDKIGIIILITIIHQLSQFGFFLCSHE